MTGTEGIGWPATPRAVGRAPGRAQRFAVPPEPAGADQAAAPTAPARVPLASMLALQELGGETVEDRTARRHGRDMLAALAELQRALLRGDGDIAALRRLAELADTVPHATDRRPAALVSAILVRARVELARRQL